jgi:hypothetical protein
MSELPNFNPNISHLKRQAKELKRAAEAGNALAVERLAAAGANGEKPSLRTAQLVIAREHGFDGWHELIEEAGERMVDLGDVHRWFGVHLNNEAWKLIDDQAISPDDPPTRREEALYRAYASAYHWRQVGNAMNQGRGEHLISRTAVLVGSAELAIRHAIRYLELIDTHPDLAEDWDHAFAHEAMARALAMAGDGRARSERLEAERLCALIAEEEERVIVEGELAREPWFGLRG